MSPDNPGGVAITPQQGATLLAFLGRQDVYVRASNASDACDLQELRSRLKRFVQSSINNGNFGSWDIELPRYARLAHRRCSSDPTQWHSIAWQRDEWELREPCTDCTIGAPSLPGLMPPDSSCVVSGAGVHLGQEDARDDSLDPSIVVTQNSQRKREHSSPDADPNADGDVHVAMAGLGPLGQSRKHGGEGSTKETGASAATTRKTKRRRRRRA